MCEAILGWPEQRAFCASRIEFQLFQLFFIFLQDYVSQYDIIVGVHQDYQDQYNECHEWLSSMQERLASCADTSGDRHTIQSRLDRIQVIYKNIQSDKPMPMYEGCIPIWPY